MPLQVIKSLKNKTSSMAYNSLLYDWSLNGDIPNRLVVKPVDPWPGNAENGRIVCGEACVLQGDQLDIEDSGFQDFMQGADWAPDDHRFTWLRDLRALGREPARTQARHAIKTWIKYFNKWEETAWCPGIMGERLSIWIALYEFYESTTDPDFQDLVLASSVRQARHLSRALPGEAYGLDLLHGIKGLLYAGIAFEGFEDWAEQALALLEAQIEEQILGDGAHISRSPAKLLSALQILIDVKTALTSAGHPLPEKIQHAIDRMGPALRFFRYADKGFALFNGAQEQPAGGGESLVDCVLGQANVRGKGLQSLPCAGYERLSQGRTTLMVDCGKSPAYPYDKTVHAAPLAFEMTYGKERVFVSCGTHPDHAVWAEALRATAAHNTASIDNRNACEIKDNGHLSRKINAVEVKREDSKDGILLDASHDGYMTLNGFTHYRRFYLGDKGHDLRGEDMFTFAVPPTAPKNVAVRFHIHPRVNVSLVKDGAEALLRLPNGMGWRFKQAGGVLSLEDSIYLGQGAQPRKTKQIVIHSVIAASAHIVKWAVQREG